jgi:Flp pilus assembly pilin Flp
LGGRCFILRRQLLAFRESFSAFPRLRRVIAALLPQSGKMPETRGKHCCGDALRTGGMAMSVFHWLRRVRVEEFKKDEDGAATIEAVLWLPIFIVLIGAAVDITMIFHAHSRVLRVVQDVNRAMSVGRITDEATAQDTMVNMLPSYPDVSAFVNVSDGIITSQVSVPVSSVLAIGMVASLMDNDIIIRTQQFLEQ